MTLKSAFIWSVSPVMLQSSGNQCNQLGYIRLLMSLLLDPTDQHRLLGILDGDVVLLLVVIHEGLFLVGLISELK